jgi:MFS transporter, NNP family, nitrate/nitrite transporter
LRARLVERPPAAGLSSRAIAGACIAIAAVGWNFANVGAVAEPIGAAYGVGLGVVGLMTTVLVLVHSICNIPAGHVSDRFGARRTALAGLFIIGATNALALITPDLELVLVARALMGIGSAAVFVASLDYIRASGGSQLAQGLLGGIGLGGTGLAVALVPLVEADAGWRAPFSTGLAAAVVGTAAFLATPRSASVTRPVHAHESGAEQLAIARDARLYRLGVLHMVSMGLAVVLGNWVITQLTRESGMSTGAAGLAGALILLLGVIGRPLGGWIARHRPAITRRAIQISFLGGGLGAALLAIGPSPPLAVVAAAIVGLSAGIPFGPVMHGAVVLRPEATAAAVGFVNMLGNAMALVGTPLLGLAFSLPAGGTIGFATAAAIWAGAALIVPPDSWLGIPARGRSDPDAALQHPPHAPSPARTRG